MAPLTLVPIRNLSYFSLMGIFSAIALVAVLVVDGIMKSERPGSLLDPMPTELFPTTWGSLPMAFGLIMAGFTGEKSLMKKLFYKVLNRFLTNGENFFFVFLRPCSISFSIS